MLARFVALLIIGFARAVTGVRALWMGTAPTALPTLYFANHRSHGDFVLLWACLPPELRARTRPVAGADYWNGSALRRFIAVQVFNALLIDRTGQRGADGAGPDPVESIAQVLDSGDSVIFFPEGTRNETDDVLLPFKGGLHKLARRCPQARFTPVWIDNLHRVLPKGELIPVPLACLVAFGQPLPAQTLTIEDRAGFLAAARRAVLDLQPEHARSDR